jgi:hypothetical protein
LSKCTYQPETEQLTDPVSQPVWNGLPTEVEDFAGSPSAEELWSAIFHSSTDLLAEETAPLRKPMAWALLG